jgi:hypothetical protein
LEVQRLGVVVVFEIFRLPTTTELTVQRDREINHANERRCAIAEFNVQDPHVQLKKLKQKEQ